MSDGAIANSDNGDLSMWAHFLNARSDRDFEDLAMSSSTLREAKDALGHTYKK